MRRSGDLVRVGFRTLVSLALCAAAAGAALAHYAIDVVGDYALARDSYDHLAHGSRELVTGIALVAAAVLAARGLRVCCEIATINRGLVARPVLRLRETIGLLFGAVAASAVMVPAMECLDGRLDGVPVVRFADAFGGSIPLGLGTTLLCAGFVALLVYGVARWLISHRDSIATMIETLLRRITLSAQPNRYGLAAQRFTPRLRQTAHALRLTKRGPPATSFV
ncbi:MAG TPA: hypothetical protein VN909_06760 [Candidatus Dormibacteraeota bacterium]|nr:hypothetical protein [Candidatus Dormibacteraeota bacterium]